MSATYLLGGFAYDYNNIYLVKATMQDVTRMNWSGKTGDNMLVVTEVLQQLTFDANDNGVVAYDDALHIAVFGDKLPLVGYYRLPSNPLKMIDSVHYYGVRNAVELTAEQVAAATAWAAERAAVVAQKLEAENQRIHELPVALPARSNGQPEPARTYDGKPVNSGMGFWMRNTKRNWQLVNRYGFDAIEMVDGMDNGEPLEPAYEPQEPFQPQDY